MTTATSLLPEKLSESDLPLDSDASQIITSDLPGIYFCCAHEAVSYWSM